MTFPVFKTTPFYLHYCNLLIFFHCRKRIFPLVTKTTQGLYKATPNDGCCHQVITTAKNYLGTRKSYPHTCLEKGEDQPQLTFWQSDPILYKLTLMGFLLLSNARRLGGNSDGLSVLPPSPCRPSKQELQQKRKRTPWKKTNSTSACVSTRKYYVPALHRVLLVLPARNLHHNTMRSFTPASPVVGEGRWGGRVSRREAAFPRCFQDAVYW